MDADFVVALPDNRRGDLGEEIPKGGLDLSPGGAAYFSIRTKTPTFEDVAQSSLGWASAFF